MSLSASGDFGLFIASFSSASKDFQHFFARLPRHPGIFGALWVVGLISQGFSAFYCSFAHSSKDFQHFITRLPDNPRILAHFLARLLIQPGIPAILLLRGADYPRIFGILLLRLVCRTRTTYIYRYRTLVFMCLRFKCSKVSG